MGVLQIINEGIKGGKGALSTVRNATRAADEALEAQRLAMEAANPPIKASEAYGKHEGAYLKPIYYDRMKVDLARNKLGGPGFSSIQLVDPNYAEAKAVAGVTDKKMGTRILNRNAANVPEGAKVIWTPSVGSLEQHKSNSTMFGEFADIFANQRKNMSAEDIQKLSDRASKEVDNKGRLIFPDGIDLGARNFRQQVKTYDQRALMANIFAGRGVGGEAGRTVPVEELLQKNLDPNMANAGTLDLGNRLFKLEGNVIDRPDLHTDYPKILTGEDLNVNYLPVPIRTVYNDWEIQKALDLAAQGKNRPVTQMDYTKNDPTIQLTEKLLTRLQKEGYAEGGEVHADFHDKLDSMIQAHMADGGEVSDFDSRLESMIKDHHNTLPDIEPAQEAPIANVTAHKQHMGNQDISRTGVSAGMNLGDMGRVGGGMNMTNVMTGKDAQLMKELMAYYSNNVGNANINANLIKPVGGNNTLMNLMGSMPVGEGRVSMGLHGSNQDGRNQLNARSVGYQTPMGGGHFNANINSPVHGSPSANVNFTKQFADGGDVHMAAGGDPRGEMRATPERSPQAAAAARALKAVHNFASRPFGYNNPPGELLSELIGLPDVANTLERIGYGEPLTTGKGMTTKPREDVLNAAMTVGPLAQMTKGMPIGAVIKPAGGNWLTGDVEKQLGRMKMADLTTPEKMAEMQKSIDTAKRIMGNDPTVQRTVNQMENELSTAKRNNSINNWIDSNLKNYVKKQMGTPEDPVRKLAEEDILHMKPYGDQQAVSSRLMSKRMGAGFDPLGAGKSDAARFWERQSDISIDPYPAGSYKHGALDQKLLEANPWLQNVPDDQMVNYAKGLNDLGFDHIMDVLRQDVREGRIRPEQLNKVSMEQAVRRTHEYDQDMARKMAETQAKVTEGMPVHKDYPDKGYKWIELKAPNYNVLPLEERKQIIARLTEEARQKGLTPEDYIEKYPENQLSEALKYEGDTMGHCVGNYCPDVLEGRSRIYSLRDTKGEPHVTVEVNPNRGVWSSEQIQDKIGKDEYVNIYKEIQDATVGKGNPRTYEPGEQDKFLNMWKQITAERFGEPPASIQQIKGKQNRAPKEDYLPYVQDFVKSGNWSDVGDLGNTGLMSIDRVPEKARYEAAGMKLPKYVSERERDELLNEYLRLTVGPPDWDFMAKEYGFPPPKSMKRGGRVNIEQEYKFKKFRK